MYNITLISSSCHLSLSLYFFPPFFFFLRSYENDCNHNRNSCPQCYREFNSFRALEQHINSGVHSAKGYRCDDCTREFSSLTALMGHCESTSCVYANNIVQTLASDYERSPQLMLTNGNVTQIEATLYFDGRYVYFVLWQFVVIFPGKIYTSILFFRISSHFIFDPLSLLYYALRIHHLEITINQST